MDRTVHIGRLSIVTRTLGNEIDSAFDRLYETLVSGGQLVLPEEFRQAAFRYLDSNAGNSNIGDPFFGCFSPIWSLCVHTGRLDLAARLWELATGLVEEWERKNPTNRVHKGTPYYFWAMTVLLQGDIDRGYILMHQSFEEDKKSHNNSRPDTPAYALVSLNADKPDQAFRPWVQAQADFVDRFVKDYASTHGRTFTIGELKSKFLLSADVDQVFLFTHTAARLKQISEMPNEAKNSGFVAQIQLNLLFDLLLVTDNAIKDKTPGKRNFIDLAESLLTTAGQHLRNDQLRTINGLFVSSFDAALNEALNGTLTIPGKSLSRLQCDVAVAYGLRNRGAHKVESVPAIQNRFDDIEKAVFRVFFGTVDFLY